MTVIYVMTSNRTAPDIDTTDEFEGVWASLEGAQAAIARDHPDHPEWKAGAGVNGRYWHTTPFREEEGSIVSFWIREKEPLP